MVKNVALKMTLFSLDITQDWLAKDSGVPAWYISSHVNGRLNLSEEQKIAIVNSLNKVDPRAGFTVSQLFPEPKGGHQDASPSPQLQSL